MGPPGRRTDDRFGDADLGDRALRRAPHGDAAADQARLERRVPGELAQGVAVSEQREVQRVRVTIDVLGDAQHPQQRADVDPAGGQIEPRLGHLAAQVERDLPRERRAGDRACDR